VRTSPSIVPGGEKVIYLVLDDFGRLGGEKPMRRRLTARH
jgi:hypothetical protein